MQNHQLSLSQFLNNNKNVRETENCFSSKNNSNNQKSNDSNSNNSENNFVENNENIGNSLPLQSDLENMEWEKIMFQSNAKITIY